jgi:hypothetical protein
MEVQGMDKVPQATLEVVTLLKEPMDQQCHHSLMLLATLVQHQATQQLAAQATLLLEVQVTQHNHQPLACQPQDSL